MRLLTTALALTAISLASLPMINNLANSQEGVEINIENIIANDQITGQIVGLTQSGKESNKVLVYVKTGMWHIHPYEHGGEGRSWATINDDGSWNIDTIYRPYGTSSVAALVVSQDSTTPARTQDVTNIPNLAITVVNLDPGHPWLGKI